MSDDTGIRIRTPEADDLQGVVELVRNCEPFLTAHRSYTYWINIQYCRETCAVAELDGEIIGWFSVMSVSDFAYFIHQIGVAPRVRRMGVATALFVYVLQKLMAGHKAFNLEFVLDRRNDAALNFNRAVAALMGLGMMKKSDVVQLLEDSQEELWVMTYKNSESPLSV
jgi:GNAT superfamily N-acetyltransferase